MVPLCNSGRTPAFTREDFPLPEFGPRLADLLAQVQSGRGFALIRGLPLDRWSREQVEAVYWGLGMEDGIQATSSVEYVGDYEPLASGFNYEKLGVFPKKPEAYR